MDYSDEQNEGMTEPGPPQHGAASYRRAAPGDLSVGALIGGAWERTKDSPLETIGGLLLVFGITYGVQMVVMMGLYVAMFGGMVAFAGLAEVVGENVARVFGVVAMGFGYLLMMSVMIAAQTLALAVYQMFWLKLIRGQEKVNYLPALKAIILPLLLSSLLVFGATMLGMVAFIVGAYVVAIGLVMTSYLIVDHNLSAVEAMKASWELMNGHKMQMLVLFIAIAAVNMVGMLACGMGMLVTMPVSIGAMALFYDRIARAGNQYLRY